MKLLNRESILGIVLFSSFYLLMSARQSYSSGSRIGFLRKKRDDAESGDLIVEEDHRFHSGDWKRMHSASFVENDDNRCEVKAINELDETILICWVDTKGRLHQFHNINDKSIQDNSVPNIHTEFTWQGHSFIFIRNLPGRILPKKLKDVSSAEFICHYTPRRGDYGRHILTFRPTAPKMTLGKRFWSSVSSSSSSAAKNDIQVSCQFEAADPDDLEIIDTSNKLYETVYIQGFCIHYEPEVFVKVAGLAEALTKDLCMVNALLPANACRRLQQDTAIWVSTMITYGTKKNPIIGKACCYHDDARWLAQHGLTTKKAGCIEIPSGEDYLQSRPYWGNDGGIMVHELSHAYHHKHCELGYDCAAVLAAYRAAMDAKLYAAVAVHGPQGQKGKAKAYACTNVMEFFAELSTAYHWHDRSKEGDEEDCEFNKWYPHHRQQLIEHDPASFAVIHRCWTQYESS